MEFCKMDERTIYNIESRLNEISSTLKEILQVLKLDKKLEISDNKK